MKSILILIIVLQMNCATYIFSKVGGFIGKPMDFFFNDIPEKTKICKYQDAEFHKTHFNYSHNFSTAGTIIGLMTNWSLAIYYPIQNRIENDKWVLCNSYEELAKEEFYRELAQTIFLLETKLIQLKKKITHLNFVEKGIISGITKQTCNFKFYIEFEGGKTALENSFK